MSEPIQSEYTSAPDGDDALGNVSAAGLIAVLEMFGDDDQSYGPSTAFDVPCA